MKLLIPFVLCLVLAPNAHAWRLGEPLSKLAEDAGHDIEHGVQNLGKAAEDVVTLGESGRRRDKEAAEHAREMAEAQRQQAEHIRQEKIKQVDQQIASAKQTVVSLESYLESFRLLKQTIETNLKTTDLLAQAIATRTVEFSTFRELIAIQQADLIKWVEHLDTLNESAQVAAGGKSAEVPSALRNKVVQYVDQINNIPKNEAQISDEQVLEQALETGFEALSLLQTNIERTTQSLQSTKELIPTLESERAKLQ